MRGAKPLSPQLAWCARTPATDYGKRTESPRCPAIPAVGGIAKGHLVKEIDALGGGNGQKHRSSRAFNFDLSIRVKDQQSGPYGLQMRQETVSHGHEQQTLAAEPCLTIRVGTVDRLLTSGPRIAGVVTGDGTTINALAVVLTSGTFLKGLIRHRPEPLSSRACRRSLRRTSFPIACAT
jgi:tRNA U34 5-carboxymethylaminomethyl modifying enzyme MnmG/GidA